MCHVLGGVMARKVSVSERALLQRINRKLVGDQECVKKSRGAATQDLGDYYRLDLQKNSVVESDVDIDVMGRKLGVLHEFEVLKEE